MFLAGDPLEYHPNKTTNGNAATYWEDVSNEFECQGYCRYAKICVAFTYYFPNYYIPSKRKLCRLTLSFYPVNKVDNAITGLACGED